MPEAMAASSVASVTREEPAEGGRAGDRAANSRRPWKTVEPARGRRGAAASGAPGAAHDRSPPLGRAGIARSDRALGSAHHLRWATRNTILCTTRPIRPRIHLEHSVLDDLDGYRDSEFSVGRGTPGVPDDPLLSRRHALFGLDARSARRRCCGWAGAPGCCRRRAAAARCCATARSGRCSTATASSSSPTPAGCRSSSTSAAAGGRRRRRPRRSGRRSARSLTSTPRRRRGARLSTSRSSCRGWSKRAPPPPARWRAARRPRRRRPRRTGPGSAQAIPHHRRRRTRAGPRGARGVVGTASAAR